MLKQHLLDNLPLDVILYEIFPYLDYNSRVTANVMLPPQDRISIPLKKDCAIIFGLHLIWPKGAEVIEAIKERGNKLVISRRHMKFGRTIHEFFFACQYRLDIRNALVAILTAFSNPDSMRYEDMSPYVKKNLPPLAASQLEKLQAKYPFIKDVTLIKRDKWTPISGHPAHPYCEAEVPEATEFVYVRPRHQAPPSAWELQMRRRLARGRR